MYMATNTILFVNIMSRLWNANHRIIHLFALIVKIIKIIKYIDSIQIHHFDTLVNYSNEPVNLNNIYRIVLNNLSFYKNKHTKIEISIQS